MDMAEIGWAVIIIFVEIGVGAYILITWPRQSSVEEEIDL